MRARRWRSRRRRSIEVWGHLGAGERKTAEGAEGAEGMAINRNAAQSAAATWVLLVVGTSIEVVGLVGFECASAHFDPRPVAAATALLVELIEEAPSFAGFVEALTPDGFRAGREFLVMDQFPRGAILRGK